MCLERVITDGLAAMFESSRATDTACVSRSVWRRTAIDCVVAYHEPSASKNDDGGMFGLFCVISPRPR